MAASDKNGSPTAAKERFSRAIPRSFAGPIADVGP